MMRWHRPIKCCWFSSPGHRLTNLGCEGDYPDGRRNTFFSRRFAHSDGGLLVRPVGRLNGSNRRRSILPMLLSPRERPYRATTCSMFSAWHRVLLQNQPMSLGQMEHDMLVRSHQPHFPCKNTNYTA